jgi:uncharacterized protein YceH (UPF0502 family)
MTLDPIQLRVLGALIEKEITTPENYPLSLNSLIAACNQRSSRDPVLDLTEDEVRQAVHSLEDMEIVSPVRDARVPKYEHRIRTVLNLRRDETAVLCLLLLRGPQTPGELRGRADRMYSFDDIAAVHSTLERLANRGSSDTAERGSSAASEPLVVMLARQPGSRESRYAHLLGGPVSVGETPRSSTPPMNYQAGRTSPLSGEEAAQLEARLAVLEDSVRQLQSRLEALEAANPQPAPPLEPPVDER